MLLKVKLYHVVYGSEERKNGLLLVMRFDPAVVPEHEQYRNFSSPLIINSILQVELADFKATDGKVAEYPQGSWEILFSYVGGWTNLQ